MLDWLFQSAQTSPVAHAVGLIALVCAAGMALGSVKFKGIGLGGAGVLFAGILAAQFSDPVEPHTLTFVKEFGLVVFVFTIGLSLGPGFFASLRSEGLRLNLLAAALILLAGVLAPLLGWLVGIDQAAVAGLFAGASTNAPALGAAQQSLATLPGVNPERLALPALACAVSYPAAVVGLLGTLVLLKVLFRVDPAQEAEAYAAKRRQPVEPLVRRTLVVENPELAGKTLDEIYQRAGQGVLISRIRSAGETEVRAALRDTQLRLGDTVLAVGPARQLDPLERLLGRASDEDLLAAPGRITFWRIAVTNSRVLGKTIAELELEKSLGVEVTRLARGDVEMTALPGLRLQFGDVLQVVGAEEQLQNAADLLGNSLKALSETQFIPLFAGIFLGVIVGSIPLVVPGLPNPVRLGLAGGPLIVALILGRIGHFRSLVWHMPLPANHAFREFGIALFFAALGLAAGDQFFATVVSPRGILWLTIGVVIAVVPLLAVGIGARVAWKMNFVTLGGMLAGGMTNPPALSFVNNLCGSESPTLAYATVYPLTTLLRILVAQVLALVLCG
ncbi:MAG TPA: putative transporter [Pirellulaceae bacterium]|nr:putative transporter [Pirellulaceae bacterium]